MRHGVDLTMRLERDCLRGLRSCSSSETHIGNAVSGQCPQSRSCPRNCKRRAVLRMPLAVMMVCREGVKQRYKPLARRPA
jgi:hypothetical protein